MSAALSAGPTQVEGVLRCLNPAAVEFVVSRSASEADSPVQCGSPLSSDAQGGSPRAMQQHAENEGRPIAEKSLDTSGDDFAAGAGAGERRDTIPAPAGQPRTLSRRSSSSSLRSGAASPPAPAMAHPGMVPAYGWPAPGYAVYHMPQHHPHPGMFHPAPVVAPPHDGNMERSASPPAVFPAGGSPPLPTGFISVPLQLPLSTPGSPTSQHMYGGSPPSHPSPFGASPPYGSSPPPGMAGSPPGMMYLPPPHMMGHHGEYMMPHSGFSMQQQQEFAQRMAGLSLAQGHGAAAQQQQQQQQRAGSSGSGTGRVEGRASARIARSHRAGGAYNPTEFEFDVVEAESGRPDARSTVMVRNIPNKYTQDMMLSVLHKSGFSGTFDFFYLPIDFRNKCNLGYCFVSFVDATSAARLYHAFHHKRWEEYNSRKVCEVTYGRVQGRDALVTHFKASKFPSDDIELMPLVYAEVEQGVASRPLPIHEFIAATASADVSEQLSGGSGGGSGEAEAEQPGEEQAAGAASLPA